MPSRDDFLPAVKTALERRAGGRCSYPGCGAHTSGPSDGSEVAVSNVGFACHITAASPKGPRYDPTLSEGERKSAENGIWMCGTHAKEIDTDETRFTVGALRAWKAFAEDRARRALGVPAHALKLEELMLPRVASVPRDADVNEPIGEGLAQSNADVVFGRAPSEALRDFLIEAAKNAFQHGGATSVTLSIEPRRVILVDDGSPFDPTSLDGRQGRGGRQSVVAMHSQAPDVLLAYERLPAGNRVTTSQVRHISEVPELAPCTLVVERGQRGRDQRWDVHRFAQCGTVFVSFPKYLSISDAYEWGARLRAAFGEECARVTLVLWDCSDRTVSVFQDFLPFARVLRRYSPPSFAEPNTV